MQNNQIKTHHLIKQSVFPRLSPEQLIRIVRMDGRGHIRSLSAYFANPRHARGNACPYRAFNCSMDTCV